MLDVVAENAARQIRMLDGEVVSDTANALA